MVERSNMPLGPWIHWKIFQLMRWMDKADLVYIDHITPTVSRSYDTLWASMCNIMQPEPWQILPTPLSAL
jgi:hypothetical protein